jgi:hypothetical protein
MGYARAQFPPASPLTDEALLAARFQVDIAGTIFAVTAHVKLA